MLFKERETQIIRFQETNRNPFLLVEKLADVSYKDLSVDFKEIKEDYLVLSFNYCHEIIKYHSKTFSLAATLLDSDRRNAIAALYSFCRITDDIIDKELKDRDVLLALWKKNITSHLPNISNPIQLAWLHTRTKYSIPSEYMEQLIAGVKMDVEKRRYRTFEDLIEYCYHVASTVGLMSMHIVGFLDKKAIPYAIQMGVALQLTNIIRDVGEDYVMGRIYIPQEDLDRFSITENHFKNKIIDESWKKMISFQIERARHHFRESRKGLSYLEPKGKWSISAAATLYEEILKMVERNNYDNLNHRAFVSKKRKLFLLSKMMVK